MVKSSIFTDRFNDVKKKRVSDLCALNLLSSFRHI